LENYKSFKQKKSISVFIVSSAGGAASNPEEMFIIPLNDLPHHEVLRSFIQRYKRRNADIPFYLDTNTKMLK
jgi:hypothetical protein